MAEQSSRNVFNAGTKISDKLEKNCVKEIYFIHCRVKRQLQGGMWRQGLCYDVHSNSFENWEKPRSLWVRINFPCRDLNKVLHEYKAEVIFIAAMTFSLVLFLLLFW